MPPLREHSPSWFVPSASFRSTERRGSSSTEAPSVDVGIDKERIRREDAEERRDTKREGRERRQSLRRETPESRRAYNGTPETMLSGIEPSASISRRTAEAAENAASSEEGLAVAFGRVKPLSMFRLGSWIRTPRQGREFAVSVSEQAQSRIASSRLPPLTSLGKFVGIDATLLTHDINPSDDSSMNARC